MRSVIIARPAVAAPEVLVFKTSVTQPGQIELLRRSLGALGRWNFDLQDCDHVLRVETGVGDVARIVGLLAAHGFDCEELPD